jgi:hypothetical protein
MVLATDGAISFALFLYDNIEDFPQTVRRGFDAGGGANYQGLTLLSLSNDFIFRIDGMSGELRVHVHAG